MYGYTDWQSVKELLHWHTRKLSRNDILYPIINFFSFLSICQHHIPPTNLLLCPCISICCCFFYRLPSPEIITRYLVNRAFLKYGFPYHTSKNFCLQIFAFCTYFDYLLFHNMIHQIIQKTIVNIVAYTLSDFNYKITILCYKTDTRMDRLLHFLSVCDIHIAYSVWIIHVPFSIRIVMWLFLIYLVYVRDWRSHWLITAIENLFYQSYKSSYDTRKSKIKIIGHIAHININEC